MLKLAPCIVLIYAIQSLKRQIQRSESAEFFAKEHLMRIIAQSYLVYTFLYLFRIILNLVWVN